MVTTNPTINGVRTQVTSEIDFVINKASERIYVQSAFSIPDAEKRAQETCSLRNVRDSFRKVVITGDAHETPWMDQNGILFIGLKAFLLDPTRSKRCSPPRPRTGDVPCHRFEQDMPERVPHILEKGSDKVAYDILKRLADGPRRPAELRAALGIASANFFTARYLTPLAKSGYIAVAGGEKNCYLPGKQYRILRKGKAVVCA